MLGICPKCLQQTFNGEVCANINCEDIMKEKLQETCDHMGRYVESGKLICCECEKAIDDYVFCSKCETNPCKCDKDPQDLRDKILSDRLKCACATSYQPKVWDERFDNKFYKKFMSEYANDFSEFHKQNTISLKTEIITNDIKKFISTLLAEKDNEVKRLITDEINICYKEGTPTSRLTSLFYKLFVK
jgi:hypothetical protein